MKKHTELYSPVILFVYNRPEHTKKTLDALVQNYLASKSDLFIFCDGPKSGKEIQSVQRVRDICHNIKGFKSIHIIERLENMGLANSIISGVTDIIKRYDRVIVLEDDLITTPFFLTYMNSVLTHYYKDPKVFSVTGYTFPSKYHKIPKSYQFDTYAGVRCASWSWGTWLDRWNTIDWEMSYYKEFIEKKNMQESFNKGGPDLTQSIILQKEKKIDSWAIRFCFAHYIQDMRCIYPIKTLVQNIGLDNSGTHCCPNPKFSHHSLEKNWLPQKFCPADNLDPIISEGFYNVFALDNHQIEKFKFLPQRANLWGKYLVKNILRYFHKIHFLIFSPPHKNGILMVNTFEKYGGAARAVYRFFLGINKKRENILYLTLFKESNDPNVIGLKDESILGKIARIMMRLDLIPLKLYPDRDKSTFSPSFFANPMRFSLKKYYPEIIHLHWIGYGLIKLEELMNISCPIVWTLHDQWAFTGGCHYSGECQKFEQNCGRCPKLSSNSENDISRKLFMRKMRVYSKIDLTIVTPSQWLANLAKKSPILSEKRIEVIPNGLDLSIFNPINHQAAKDYFGIPQNIPVLLFSSHSLTDPRKGADLMIEALQQINIPCILFSFGGGNLEIPSLSNINYRSLGSPVDDLSLVMAYSAADLYLCPTREDNLPNVVAEALACGTPCVAFDVGGLPEMIEHRINGWIAKAFDIDDFAKGIQYIISHPHPHQLRKAAREKALKEYDILNVSEKYLNLFDELLNEKNKLKDQNS